MLKVDIIIPPIFLYLRNFQSFRFPIYRRNIKWFPVWYYQKDLRKMGVKIRFLNFFKVKENKLSNIIAIDNEVLNLSNNLQNFIKTLKKKGKFLIWFDHSDSSSEIQNCVISYVDRYLKKQLLKDRSLYLQKLYNNRIFCDFYARNYNIDKHGNKFNDNYIIKSLNEKIKIKSKDLQKLGLSWNLGLIDYNNLFFDEGPYKKLTQYISIISNKTKLKFTKPSIGRKMLFSANFSYEYPDKLISFPRKYLFKLLVENYNLNKNISIGFVPRKKYLEYAARSKAIFSPFGYGEICFRDFETFLAGAALIKQNMDHIITWPSSYKKYETYIPLPWKIESWENKIIEILADNKLLLEIAKNGQYSYKMLWTKEGKQEFCNRFIRMISPD